MSFLKQLLAKHYLPDLYFSSVADAIDMVSKPAVMLDLDNCLVAKGADFIPGAVLAAIVRAKREGRIKKIIIVSNIGFPARWGLMRWHKRYKERAQHFADQIGAELVCATWPHLKGRSVRPIEAALKLAGAIEKEAAIIGDQLLTDVKSGKKAHIQTILVVPTGKDGITSRLRRIKERLILNFLDAKPQ